MLARWRRRGSLRHRAAGRSQGVCGADGHACGRTHSIEPLGARQAEGIQQRGNVDDAAAQITSRASRPSPEDPWPTTGATRCRRQARPA
jgi:hypothetical protein